MFEYTDPDGDRLTAIGIPDCGRLGPAVSFILKRADTNTSVGLFIPTGRVEEVVAGIRDAARQAVGQPDTDETVRVGRCPVMLQGGGRCEKNADHRPPGSDDPHTPEPPAAGLAAPTNHDTDLAELLAKTLTERFTELGNPGSGMRIQFKGPDGWPASRSASPNDVAAVLRELLAAGAES